MHCIELNKICDTTENDIFRYFCFQQNVLMQLMNSLHCAVCMYSQVVAICFETDAIYQKIFVEILTKRIFSLYFTSIADYLYKRILPDFRRMKTRFIFISHNFNYKN